MKYLLTQSTLIVVFAFSIVFTSCEGYRHAIGTVVNAEDNTPLDSVFVNVLTGNMQHTTDSTGTFNVENNFTSCTPQCPDIIVQFSKAGYKTEILANPNDSVIVTMYKK